MIEATCAACGAVNRMSEADVPVGAKFVSCTSCKSKVVLPAKAASGPAPGKPAANPVAIPTIPRLTPPKGVPAPPKAVVPPPKAAPPSSSLDISDLPAPKRQSPLAGAEAQPKPAPRSALAGTESTRGAALDGAELPVPKSGPKPPAPQPNAIDLDDLMPESSSPAGLADLPAPKARTSALADLPAPKGPAKSALTDLPAPKGPAKSALTDLPAPKAPAQAAAAKPSAQGTTAKPTQGTAAKPPPQAAQPSAAKPPASGAARKPANITDLPAPKPGVTDLLAPKGAAKDTLDLDDFELPNVGITDLPTPKLGVTDLPMPKPGANNDLLAPKGFFEDLPQPAKKSGGGGIDLPAPKGFFEDLPQPAKKQTTQDIAPKGFFDDLPQAAQKQTTQDIAPKGFFEDLPQPAKKQTTQDIAPKGFFEDLPQPAKKQTTQDIAPKGFFDDLPQPAKKQTQDIAPKGFFDDLPQPAKTTTSQEMAPKAGLFDDLPNPGKAAAASGAGLFDDLQAPGQSAADRAMGAGDIDLGPATDIPSLELDTAGPALDLDAPGDGSSNAFQDLDLSEPTKPAPIEEGSPIRIKTPSKGGAPRAPIPINVPSRPMAAADLKLDLADESPAVARGAVPAATANKITPKKKGAETATPEARAAKTRRTRIVLGSLLLVAALGAGGFFFYQRHAAAQRKAEAVTAHIETAAKALKSDDPKHWMRAAAAADEAIELDAKNPRALGIAAEALIAGALDNGTNLDARIKKGRNLLQEAIAAGSTPEVERAQAVAAIAAKGQAARAVELTKALIAKAPKDGWLKLYLGWAQLAKGDAGEAVKAFDQAIATTPGTKVPALYGQGQAKLLLADIEGAKEAFGKILEINKDHVCANVGLIATYPPSKSIEQVDELKAVLQRKDIATADPRCVVQAHTLIGDVHRRAGRLEMARQSYRDALELVKDDVPARVGLAAVELRENNTKVAADLIEKALASSADHAGAMLLAVELKIREGKLGDAEKDIEKLGARQPPLLTLAQAQLFIVRGKLAEAKGEDEAAITAYLEGAKLAGALDLTPTMLAVKKLTALAKKASDPTKATEYRNRAAQLLQPLEANAQDDVQLSIALGIAYMEAADFVKAETLLRRAVAMKAEDPEAKLQLSKALNAQSKSDEAALQLREAQKLDPKRIDIALELAKTLQAAGRHDEAITAYEQLLALPDVPIVVRVDAGRYYARRGMIDKAAEQAKPILDAESENPGGLYLKAEGLLKANKPEEAAPLLTRASDADPDAQYLDALGRALEARWRKSNDGKYIEGARAAYERASNADPKLFHPWLGQGKMRVANKDWEAAIKPLLEASKLDKSSSEVMFTMGLAYYGLGRSTPKYKPMAAQWLESALKGRPELAVSDRADASFKLGELYNDTNSAANAIRAYDNAIRLAEELEKQGGATHPKLVEAYYLLGDLYYKTGNCSAQKRSFERYIAREPDKNKVQYKAAQHALATSLQRC